MRVFRKRLFTRSIAVFLLGTFLQSIFLPQYAQALTTGPHQPEYTSYEEPGATDMVNLLTGDFSFSLPVLDVPGPEGSFSLPLTYNAGVGTDQEASWVGLGWSMNPGVILRDINQYPDDANGEAHSITMKDLTGLRGWTSSVLGLGNIGWNTDKGHYGSISLLGLADVNWDNSGVSSVGVAGVSVGKNGVGIDAVKMGIAILSFASMGGVSALKNGAEFAKQASLNFGMGAFLSFGTSMMPSALPSVAGGGAWSYNMTVTQGLFYKNYWIWLDKTRTEKMYGSLYLGNSPTQTYSDPMTTVNFNLNGTGQSLTTFSQNSGAGSASDINQYIDPGKSYSDIDNPIAIADDSYSVKAPGISGAISPYRLETGAVSMPREMTSNHVRFNPVSFLNNYKVPFVYEGANNGSYFHHVGSATTVTQPTFYLGATSSTSSDPSPVSPCPCFTINMNVTDPTLQTNRIRSDVATTNKLPSVNHVEWLSNEEILNETMRASVGFMDFLSGTARTNFRQTIEASNPYAVQTFYSTSNSFSSTLVLPSAINTFTTQDIVDLNLTVIPANGPNQYVTISNLPISSVAQNSISFNSPSLNPYLGLNVNTEIILKKVQNPQKSIGGYSITNSNGLTYHFALPVYDFSHVITNKDVLDPNNKQQIFRRVGGFANAWLLTAITGPDFVDRGGVNNAPNGIVDMADWGYWVKINYAKLSTDFQWRLPYQGDVLDAKGTSMSNAQGTKQMYYLNSIETRSHVAIFFKDFRNDSRSVNGVQSVKLNEICLVNRDVFNKLVLPVAQGGYGLPDVTSGINNFCWAGLANNCQPYLYQNTLKRIALTHTYDLCPGTPNSNASTGGKLTLTRLSVMGRNSAKVVPDYLFEYANNPGYGVNLWDGWGMYSSQGTTSNHKASYLDSDAAAWSLTRVTTPLGSQISVNYERDTYGLTAGLPVYDVSYQYSENRTQSPITGMNSLTVPNATAFAVNDPVLVEGAYTITCPGGSEFGGNYSVTTTIASISGNTITLNAVVGSANNCSGATATINYNGTITKGLNSQKGGNIRVGSIVLSDQSIQHKTRYLYTNASGTGSSGVVTMEPEYVRNKEYSVYNLPGYPTSPVMYGRVSVLTGKLTDDTDYHTKEVYNFETPNASHFVYEREAPVDRQATIYPTNVFYWTLSHHKLTSNKSKIGRINSIERYSKTGLESSQQMTYTNQPLNGGVNQYQGVYSRGAIIFDNVNYLIESAGFRIYRYSKTTVLSYPNVLSKVTNTKDGFVNESENLSWDLLSGIVTEKIERSPLGLNVKTVVKPAYLVPEYAAFGPKSANLSNKNLLGAIAATYVYMSNSSGTVLSGLVSANAQTWRNDWSYRVLSSGTYGDLAEGPGIWRKSSNYTYVGNYSKKQADGTLTLSGFTEFGFSNPGSNLLWQKTGESSRYDHYAMPLENLDMNLIPSSTKMGYGDQLKIAEAINASYTEMAFSGAEDLNTGTNFFGGEVAPGSGTLNAMAAHTGTYSLSVPAGSYGFIFKTSSLRPNRIYRVSAWMNSSNGQLYYKLNGGAEQVSPAPQPSQLVGGWYLVDFQIPVGATFTSLEVGVKSASGTVSFDDFRFQPIDGSMNTYVYTKFGELQYQLDNDNLFIKYEYNDRGQLTKTYRESLKYGVKLISETRDNYRRFTINP